jgi:hypothetical protein
MELAAKCVFIYGLQQVTGKILMSKNLGDKKRGERLLWLHNDVS